MERAWTAYWDVRVDLIRTPADQRMKVAARVAVEPNLSRLVATSNGAEQQRVDNYGQVEHRISWKESISGEKLASIHDCQDQSAFGAIDTSTKKKLTVGTAHVNLQGDLELGGDGKWRVRDVTEFTGDACTG